MRRLSEIIIEVITECPLHCIFCSSSYGLEASLQRTIIVARIKEFLEQNQYNNRETLEVKISGGEPLLYHELIPLVKELAVNQRISVWLYSSGITGQEKPITLEYARMLVKSGLKGVTLSLYAADSSIHNQLTQTPNSWKKTITAIKNFIKAGVTPSIHFIPMKPNYRELPALCELCRKLGVKTVKILRFIPHGRAAKHRQQLELSPEQFQELLQNIKTLQRQYGNSLKITYGHPIACELNENTTCQAAKTTLTILPDGSIYPCSGLKNTHYKLGNIYHDTLQQALENAKRILNPPPHQCLAQKLYSQPLTKVAHYQT